MKEDLSTVCCEPDPQGPSHPPEVSSSPRWSTECLVFEKPAPRPELPSNQEISRAPISIREVGRRIGISHSTVSLVLRNDPRISGPTRTKVMAALAEMDYRPDPTFHALARASRSRAAACVALIEPAGVRTASSDYGKGVTATAKQFGYDVETFITRKGAGQAELHRALERRGVRAIILSPRLKSCEWKEFPWDRYAVVKIGHPVPGPKFHTVGEDEWLSAMDGFATLLRRGYQRIGMVSALAAAGRHDPQYLNGFLQARQRVQNGCRLEIFSLWQMSGSIRTAALEAWMAAERPDVIFTDVTDSAWICQAAGSRGVDVAFCSDPGEGQAGMLPAWSGIGESAFDLLRSLLHDCCYGEPGISCRKLVPATWVDGHGPSDGIARLP